MTMESGDESSNNLIDCCSRWQGDVGSRGLPGLPGPPGEGLQGPLVFDPFPLDQSHHFKANNLNMLLPIYWTHCFNYFF